MLTVEKLKSFGANTDEGIARCMGNEGFYLMLVPKVIDDKRLGELESGIAEKDYKKAFEAAHALKGMFANLSLDPLTKPVSEMTELLGNGVDTDYSGLLKEAKDKMGELRSLNS